MHESISRQRLIRSLSQDNDPITLKGQLNLLSQHPHSFSLLSKFINASGFYGSPLLPLGINNGTKTPPPNFFILHCEMGAEVERAIRYKRRGGLTIIYSDLMRLRAEFLNQINALPNDTIDILYIGGGHGGDFNSSHNLRNQMNGIDENCWQQAFTILNQKTRFSVQLIIAESCYSAAYSSEFKSILSDKGVCLCNILECTPYEGLLESCVRRTLDDISPLLPAQAIIPSEAMARIILNKFGIRMTGRDVLDLVIEELNEILPPIFNDPSRQFTEEDFTTMPTLQCLFEAANEHEVTYAELNTASAHLCKEVPGESKAIDLWDYYDPINLAPHNFNSVNQMMAEIQAKLLPIYGEERAKLLAAAYSHTVVVFTAGYTRLKTAQDKDKFFSDNGINRKDRFLLTPTMMSKTTNHSFENMQPLALVVSQLGETSSSLLRRLNTNYLESTAKCFMTKHHAFLPEIATKPDNASLQDWRHRRDIQIHAIKNIFNEHAVVPLESPRLYSVMEEFSSFTTELSSPAVRIVMSA